MTNFAKARWSAKDNEIRLGMEFSKVDKERRMVAGWATLDNVDTENDIVTAEASADAFKRSRMNLREMHKKDSAVGRIVSFKEDTFRAPDGKEYRGIFVKVRVSKGAPDTWEKVLDGTLNGFSIGGNILEAEEILQKDGRDPIRKVTKYDLNELSLVDNPGNQYSDVTHVFKMKKSADGSVTSLTGMVEDYKMLNVFYCDEDKISKESASDSLTCPVCDNEMKEIGFIEDGSDREEKVSTLVTKFVKSKGGVTMTKNKEDDSQQSGGNPVDYVNDDQAKLADPTGPDDEVGDVDEVDEEETDEAENVEEVPDEQEEIAKKIDSLKSDISEILTKSNQDTAEKIATLEKSVSETREFIEERIKEMDNKFSHLTQDLNASKSKQIELERSLEKINSSSAFKKSVDVEDDSTEQLQRSDTGWNGAFSVDNLFR